MLKKIKVNIINLKKTWEKLLLAARAIAAVKIIIVDVNSVLRCSDYISSRYRTEVLVHFLDVLCFVKVENPLDVFIVASRPQAQRAVLKFAR